ncbi:hypothetical protein LTR28_013634, partial [Elasticomyces elasticus]
ILGAEKALFRALKTKGNTPKYGLIYHSSFIGKAGQKNKGRISRFLANKTSIASRIDNFSEHPTTKFGEALKAQVEERLNFYATGEAPTKNEVAMSAAMNRVLGDINIDDPTAGAASDEEMADGVTAQATQQAVRRKKEKEAKKEKKSKRSKAEDPDDAIDAKAAKREKKRKRESAVEEAPAVQDKKEKKRKRVSEDVGGVDEVKEKKKKSRKSV